MKGAVLALFCAAAVVSAELNENGCPINPHVDILKPHPNCHKYYQCVHGKLVVRKCPSGLYFNVKKQECDWPANVDCGNRPIPERNEESGDNSNESGNNVNGNEDPSEAKEICALEGSNGVLVAHEDCSKFYECANGVPVAFNCYKGLLYNIEKEQCDWPNNVNCDGRYQGGNGGNDGRRARLRRWRKKLQRWWKKRSQPSQQYLDADKQ